MFSIGSCGEIPAESHGNGARDDLGQASRYD